MSRKPEKKSGAESDQPEKNSVYDFLYHDARRIGSFLSQFDPKGHLQSLVHSRSVSETASDKAGITASAGLPGIAKIQTPIELQESSSDSEAAARTYDPIWANALAFLDYLSQHSLVQENIETARIGQFVQCTGGLTLVDTSFVQRMYKHETIRAKARRMLDPATGLPKNREDVDVDLDALQEIPPQVQAYLASEAAIIYCGLKPEGMVASPADLMMKYGTIINGKWTIIGIKDAEPEWVAEKVVSMVNALKAIHKEMPFLTENLEVLTRVRAWLGRPMYCYGVTPLAILREIGA